MIIFSAKEKNGIIQATKEKIGTVCIPKNVSKTARQKRWQVASLVIGSIVL